MKQEHGILLLNKPKGMSSAYAIGKLKRLGQKKIGHAGTLDPMATGLLIVLLGEATKIMSYLLEGGEKTYVGTAELGVITDTWDAEGQVLEKRDTSTIDLKNIEQEIASWHGVSTQEVPPYSAAKHEGQALYKLARAGKETPVKTKEIFISHAEIQSVDFPSVRFRVTCSSGSYIRSLAHSLGIRLGCGAMLTELIREYSHPFSLENACELDALLQEPERLTQNIIPITKALPEWRVIEVNALEAKAIGNGNPIAYRPEFGEFILAERAFLSYNNKPIALVESSDIHKRQEWLVLRGLLTD